MVRYAATLESITNGHSNTIIQLVWSQSSIKNSFSTVNTRYRITDDGWFLCSTENKRLVLVDRCCHQVPTALAPSETCTLCVDAAVSRRRRSTGDLLAETESHAAAAVQCHSIWTHTDLHCRVRLLLSAQRCRQRRTQTHTVDLVVAHCYLGHFKKLRIIIIIIIIVVTSTSNHNQRFSLNNNSLQLTSERVNS